MRLIWPLSSKHLPDSGSFNTSWLNESEYVKLMVATIATVYHIHSYSCAKTTCKHGAVCLKFIDLNETRLEMDCIDCNTSKSLVTDK